MKILNLKLKGAIGIKKGLGVDQLEIDFTKFQPGLIALTGKNGSGKTTIMENLHPYRQMVSRDGSLQTHFFLKDSYRILEFEQDGNLYQSHIKIDALTGGSEAYLFCNGKPLNDGKLSTYDGVLEEVLGSSKLFFNSVFSGQKSKGIAELTAGDRRKLFYELLNLDKYENYLAVAKENLKTNEMKLAEAEGEIRAISNPEENAEDLEKQRVESLEHQIKLTNEISELEQKIEELQKLNRDQEVQLKLAEDKVVKNMDINREINSKEELIKSSTGTYNMTIIRMNSDLSDNQKLLERNQKLATVEAKIKIDESLKLKVVLTELLNKQKDELANHQKLYSTHQKKYSESLKEVGELEKVSNQLKTQLGKLDTNILDLQQKEDRALKDSEIIKDVPCDEQTGSTCKFLLNAYDSRKSIPEAQQKKAELKKEYNFLSDTLAKSETDLNSKKLLIDQTYTEQDVELRNNISDSELNLQATEKNLAVINKNDWEKLQSEYNEAGNNIKLLEEKIANINTRRDETKSNFDRELERISNEINDLQKKYDNTLGEVITRINTELSSSKHKLIEHGRDLDTTRKTLEAIQRMLVTVETEIETLKRNDEKIQKLTADKSKIENEIKEWSFLCKAFDKTGIPVLKLENSGIEITTIANELLSIFENKFRIVFETTSLTKDKKKMKETFDINVVEEDGVCEISNKSGGQQVWLETAIQCAISLVVRQQGRNIQTSFLDEKDGALDLDNAFAYIEMLKRAHQLSGVHNTFIITHRPELLDFIPQQVKLRDGILELMD